MVDYVEALKYDLLEQFKGKPNIEAVAEVVGHQFQNLFDFFDQILNETSIFSSVGKQLDFVGDVEVLSRAETAKLAQKASEKDVDDELYRSYLIHKTMQNTCNCAYPEIMKSFRMFWNKPLYYSENKDFPATIFLDTREMEGLVDTSPLFQTPLLKPAGVAIELKAITKTEIESKKVTVLSGLGYAITETEIPQI